MSREKRNNILWILLIANMLVISIMTLLMLSNICLNYDEFFSMNWTALSWKEMMTTLKADVHPPLYYVGLKLVRFLFGAGVLQARIFSAIPAMGLILLTLLVRREIGWKAAFWYINLLAGNGFWYQKATEIRMYPWLSFWCVCNAFCFLLILQHNRKRNWILFAFCGLCAAYTQYYGIPLMICTYIGLGIWAFASKEKQNVQKWLLVCVFTVVAYLPWLPIAISQVTSVTDAFWIPKPASNGWLLLELFDSTIPHLFQFYELILVALPVLAFIGVIIRKGEARAKNWWMLISVSCVWVLWLIGVVYAAVNDRPVLLSRYLIAGVLVFVLGSSLYAEKIPYYITIIFCIVFFITGSNYFYQRFSTVRDDQTEKLIRFCDEQIEDKDTVYFWEDGYGYLKFCMDYYITQAEVVELNTNRTDMVKEGTIWFFQNERVSENENVSRIESEMEYVGEYSFGTEKVWIYRKE